jgi:hypothetical protein
MADELGTGTTEGDELETFELLNTEDPPEETLDITDKPKKELGDDTGEAEEEEEEDPLKEIEDELKPPTEEDLLELTTPVRRKEILAKYPSLFKDFPYLEKAYYREQQFTELLPTIQDARIAVEKAQILDRTEQEVMNGNISSVLRAAKAEDGEAFNRIADNYLQTLRHVDQGAYFHVLGNVIKDTIITMVREGNALGENGSPLKAAANILNQFVFGSQNFTPPVQLARQVNPEDQSRERNYQLEQQNRLFERFDGVRSDLQTKADNVLRATIDGHIDPKGTMTDYVKTHAAKEALTDLESLIGKDARFRSLLDKLWEKAFQSNFDKESTDRIKSAYLSKAKTLLPSVIQKARREALRERGSSRNKEEESLTLNKGPVTPGKSTSPSSGKMKSSKDIPKGMSTIDFLNS